MARQVLPVVGAIIGGYIGGPQGAQIGWAIGSVVGNAVDPQVIRGPSIGDIANQTSQEGVPRPIVFGLSQPIAGNVIASGPPRVVKTQQSQGKGGPKVETESVYRTYAIGVCEGEHTFVRVWKNSQLVYDISESSQLTPMQNAKFLEVARFFDGTFTQNPSPDLESIFGVGTTPAHRGTCYMVMADDDLTDMRGAIPQFTFQVGNAVAPLNYDPILEMHFDGHDGDTTTTDDSLYAHEVSITGSGEISDVRAVCGDTSIRMGETGEIVVSHESTLNLGDRDFTIEMWFYFEGPSISDGGVLFRKQGFTSLYPIRLTWGETGALGVEGAVGEDEDWPAGTTAYSIQIPIEDGMEPNTWHHIAVERYGSTFTLFLDGVPFEDEGNPVASPPIIPGTYEGKLADNTADIRILNPGSGTGLNHAHIDELYYLPYAKYQGGAFTPVQCEPQSVVTLADVVTEICERASLPASLIDVTELTDEVIGFTVINTYPAYAALQALSNVYQFDPSDYDGKIHFVKRGANSVATITASSMIDTEDAESSKRADTISIPRVLHLNYFDVAGGLATDKQTSERSGDRRSDGETALQTSVVLDANTAARVVSINHKVIIENAKGELTFGLPDSYIYLTPADNIVIEWDGVNRRVRLTQVDIRDGFQEYKALHDRQSAYTSNVEGIPSAPQTPPPSSVVGPTLLEILDIHILIDADDNIGLLYYAAVSGVLAAWQGAQVELSLDGGENYISSSSTTVAATMGETLTVLPDHPQAIPDMTSTVRVRIDTPLGELHETDLEGMLNGENLAIIGNELIQFANSDEVSEGVWDISYLLRGRKGSATESHPIGSRFILLNRSTLTAVPANLSDIGRTLTFRATSFGTSVDQGVVTSITYGGISQTEREVGYLTARRDGSNAVIEWQGIGRLGSGAQVAHGLRFAGYRVTISDGVTTDTETTSNQSLTHDISAFSTPITITVQQLNDLTGAGPATQVTLT